MSGVKNKWLIKSDNRILGPYTGEQVEELVLKKQISLIDEVRDMATRWSYLRELNDFKHLVDIIRNEQDRKSELTKTIQTGTSQTNNDTVSHQTTTKSIHGQELDFSEVSLSESNTEANSNQAEPSEPISPQKTNKTAKPAVDIKVLKPVKAKKSLWKRTLLVVVGFGVIVAGGFATIKFQQQKAKANADSQVLSQLRRNSYLGQHAKVVELFKKVEFSFWPKALLEVIPSWSQLNNAKVISYDEIFKLVESAEAITNEKKSWIELVKFNINFSESNFEEANKNIIKSLDYMPTSELAQENNAILTYTEGQYSESVRLFKELYDRHLKGRFLVGYVLSYIKAKNSSLEHLIMSIDSYNISHEDFKKELLMLKLYLLQKTNQTQAPVYQNTLTQFLKFPFQLAKLFRIEGLIYASFYNWNLFESNTQEVLNFNAGSPTEDELKLNILIENDKLVEAGKLVSKLKANQDIQTRWAYLTNNFGVLNKRENELTNSKQEQVSMAECLDLLRFRSGQSYSASAIIILNKACPQIENVFFKSWISILSSNLTQDRKKVLKIISENKNYEDDFLPFVLIKELPSE